MQPIKLMQVVMVALLAATLTSCNTASATEPAQDAIAIYTSVAGTMIAQLGDQQTQTAQAVPPSPAASSTVQATLEPPPTIPELPSNTPFSINTPGSLVTPPTSVGGLTYGVTGVGCNDAAYLSTTEPGDGTKFKGGVNFTKSWTFQNTGTCTWINSYSFAFVTGDRLGGKDVPISRSVDFVTPGHIHSFTVNLEAPRRAGEYRGCWQMKNDIGTQFGARVCVDIVVK
jgi:hypothetical protein